MGTQARRLLLNLGLLLLVAGLGGFAWWQTQQTAPTPETLLSVAKTDITQVSITRQPGTAQTNIIRLEKQDGHWQMREPKTFPANPTRMTQLFTLLDETVQASYDAAGKDLKTYGLEPGLVTVSFNNENLTLGMENPVSHNRYLLHAGKIKLVPEAVTSLLIGTVENWLANKLVPPGRTLQQVTLPNGYNNKPKTLQNWQSADAIRIEAWDGKTTPYGQIQLGLDDGSTITLALLGQDGDLVLGHATAGIRYVLPEPQRENLLPR